ncbi:adenylate/guanylate cyclase domain-containing protein [Methylomicrobium sp. Wu6]|uniref:CHASE2 domain-containing protein n=1 Tax=Methylomicrobium sp. Wu6 TaxID=3107928 RepID=UPI002DD6359D|nr:adenylate/guanylate cyclase domain-containing protein [Methylomicrobium sp. Wu6]MEC4747951.1 adenylate/guanylate cyclase domain-containing protein [Methylomicrobium sp. Wu6]
MNVYKKTSNAVLSALLIGTLGAALNLTKLGLRFEEEWGLAALFKVRGAISSPRDVIIVNVDKSSEEQLRLPENPEKWPRSTYARLIEALNRYEPAVIALNIYFGEVRDAGNDIRLAKAIASGKNVILSNYLKQYTFPSTDPAWEFTYEKIINPIPAFANAALGAAPFPLPKTASTVKQFWTYKKSAGSIPTFPVSVFQCYALNRAYPEILRLLQLIEPALPSRLPPTFAQLAEKSNVLEISELIRQAFATKSLTQLQELLAEADYPPESTRLLQSWFTLAKGSDNRYFNHYGKTGAITTIPFHQLLENKHLNPELFRRKVVLVGYSENLEPEKLQGFYTEFSGGVSATVSTTEIAATAVANLIDNNAIRPLPLQSQCLLIMLWSFLLFGVCRLCSHRLAASLMIGLTAAYAGFAYFQFAAAQIWLPLFIPLLLQTPAAAIALIFSYLQKNKQNQQNLHKTLSYYLPDNVVSDIAKQSELEAITHYGGLVRGVCMTTDAGQYTTLSETMDPLTLKSVLNQYYGEMFPLVKYHHGIISDVIGDAMLALWAAPLEESRHKINACRAALEIKAAIDRFNRSQSYQLPTRLGLHFGEMHLGNVGAMEHFEYRAVGDIVNTAVRIEGLNKLLGTQILVSSSVIEGVSGFFTREVGAFVLKGKTYPVILFELIAPTGQVDPYWLPLAAAFAHALRLFQNYQWTEALNAFLDIEQRHPDDGPTLFYIQYLNQRPPAPPATGRADQPARIELDNITNRLHFLAPHLQ